MLGAGTLNYTADGYIDYSGIPKELDPPMFPHFDFEFIYWKEQLSVLNRNPNACVVAIVVYLIGIFGLQKFMEDRDAFDLKRPLFLWNAALGLMSIVGFWRVAPEFVWILWNTGFHSSVCVRPDINVSSGFWAAVFVYSKFLELGDTVFIVLRKRPLTFLQWGHHSLTLASAWLTTPLLEPIARYYMFMNYGVHSLMYPYFALRALDIKLPRKFANLITTLQLIQMFIGFFVNTYSGVVYHSGRSCIRHPKSIQLFSFVYGLFIYLFGKLYYDLVVSRRSSKKNKSD